MLARLAYKRINEKDLSDPESLTWYFYVFATAMIVAIQEWKANERKRDCHGHASSGAVHPKAVPKCARKCRSCCMKRDFAKLVGDRFSTDGVYLKLISSIEEQCAFVRDMASRRSEVDGETEDVGEE